MQSKFLAGVWEIVKFGLIVLVIVMPIRLYIAQPFIVAGESMAPTFSSGDYLIIDELTYNFIKEPSVGEVVVFRYPQDPSKFFIKRIVGLPGEELVVDGVEWKLGDGEYFVMGDNRKASLDSRHDIAFLPEKDIHYVLPLDDQDIYENLWRDASRDEQYAHSTTLAAVEFVSALNAEREKRHLKKLNLDNLLSQSGTIRAKAILESDDFSTEATRSGLDLSRSVAKSGYRNIILGELITRGFYESEELMENFREFPQSAELLYSDEYQDIGVSSVIDEIRGCPTQAVVIHLGGYKPPNYDKDEVAGWGSLIDNLREVTPSWEKLKGADTINQEKLERLLYLLNIRLDNAVRIHDRLSKNQWLTEDEEKLVSMDKDLHNEAQNLINELNRP